MIFEKSKSKQHITNGIRCAPCSGARGSDWLGRSPFGLALTPASTHILQTLVFATQSPHSGLQNVVYLERYVQLCRIGYKKDIDKKPKIA